MLQYLFPLYTCWGLTAAIGYVVAMVVSATYTANLASFLSGKPASLAGPADMDALANSIACAATPHIARFVAEYVRSTIVPPSGTTFQEGVLWCMDQVTDGNADILLSERFY